ncbi:probable ribonuclease ZC3H12D [Malaya genurostris]|uniref:probable ribonuclease ZC3H12D n=1 Tax=Malaya genurostris TaxID=325434 RepID=UPI0026F38F4B|nr:probable ribonuclease ZC3H12D [Malaya genurostris]
MVKISKPLDRVPNLLRRKVTNSDKRHVKPVLGRRHRKPAAHQRRPRDDNRISGRIVLLDACNIGYGHPNQRGFSIEGLRIAIQYFLDRNLETYAMLPKFRLKPGKSTDSGLLNILFKNGRLITTPCKEFPVRAMCYDDRFMLEIAARFNCAVVSNDQYRDIMNEKPEWREVVDTRRIPFQWYGDTFTI